MQQPQMQQYNASETQRSQTRRPDNRKSQRSPNEVTKYEITEVLETDRRTGTRLIFEQRKKPGEQTRKPVSFLSYLVPGTQYLAPVWYFEPCNTIKLINNCTEPATQSTRESAVQIQTAVTTELWPRTRYQILRSLRAIINSAAIVRTRHTKQYVDVSAVDRHFYSIIF